MEENCGENFEAGTAASGSKAGDGGSSGGGTVGSTSSGGNNGGNSGGGEVKKWAPTGGRQMKKSSIKYSEAKKARKAKGQ